MPSLDIFFGLHQKVVNNSLVQQLIYSTLKKKKKTIDLLWLPTEVVLLAILDQDIFLSIQVTAENILHIFAHSDVYICLNCWSLSNTLYCSLLEKVDISSTGGPFRLLGAYAP